MDKAEMSKVVLAAKRRMGITWSDLAATTGMSEVWIASVFHGENSASASIASVLAERLALSDECRDAMVTFPMKGSSLAGQPVPLDPLLYRFYEILAVYGPTLKDVIQEKFGDGIMSAIDFTMSVDKVEDPKGDRVVITMNGKFLPYKKW
jgi:cyanate lyase